MRDHNISAKMLVETFCKKSAWENSLGNSKFAQQIYSCVLESIVQLDK